MIDLHSHILPGIDDGPDSIEKTLEILNIYAEEGFQTIAATHHFNMEKTSVDAYYKVWNERYQEVQLAIENNNLDLKIVKGAEVRISPFLLELGGLENLCINGSRYILLELPSFDIPYYTEDLVFNMRLKGLTPIIAHPERNRKIIEDPNSIQPILELGALGQVTAGSITGFFGKSVQRCAKILLDHNMAHFIGTDAHSSKNRSPRVRETVKRLMKWTSQSNVDLFLNKIPQDILQDRFFEVLSPMEYKKRMFFMPKRRHESHKYPPSTLK